MSEMKARWFIVGLLCLSLGCTRDTVKLDTDPAEKTTTDKVASVQPDATPTTTAPGPEEVDTDKLLEACLSEDQLKDGWIRLFDGQSLYGWFFLGQANWHVQDGTIAVDNGEPSFLCTNFELSDYELMVDFKCPAATNSGVFLRSTAKPEDVSRECFELNIAPEDNPFPTGSFVKRQKVDPEVVGKVAPDTWHTYRILMEGDTAKVWLDGKEILQTKANRPKRGYIALQHNSGAVQFRNVLLKPLASQPLALDDSWEKSWTKKEKEAGSLTTTVESDGLRLKGGLAQLESKDQWDDFVLQATYQLKDPKVNSGIFFRCIPGNLLDGYECQLNHAFQGDHRNIPTDFGAGGIFRRAPARVVVGDGTKPTYVTIIAQGNQFATWIDGLQVVDFNDTRPADENPRQGSRTKAGTIALQSHDPETEVLFQKISVAPIATNK